MYLRTINSPFRNLVAVGKKLTCKPYPNNTAKKLLNQRDSVTINDARTRSYLVYFPTSPNPSERCQAIECVMDKLEITKDEVMFYSKKCIVGFTLSDYQDKMFIAKPPPLPFHNVTTSCGSSNNVSYYRFFSPFRKLKNWNIVNSAKTSNLLSRSYATAATIGQTQSPLGVDESSKDVTQVMFKTENPSDAIHSGAMDFKDYIETSNLWVDKSLLISRILKLKGRVVLVTCPRKWGKSLNLSMLQYLLDAKLDAETKTMMHDFFTKGQYTVGEKNVVKMNTTPLIAQNKEFMKTYFHKRPVIYLDFRGITHADWFDEIKKNISMAFQHHEYLLEDWNTKLRSLSATDDYDCFKPKYEDRIERFNLILRRKADRNTMKHSIQDLSLWLKERHKVPTVVLIDEFDSLYNDILFSCDVNSEDPPSEGIKFMREFMDQTFKSCANSGIEKAVLTGILRTAKSTMLSGLNNVLHDVNLIDLGTLAPFYGFSSNEVEHLVKHAGIEFEKEKQDIMDWYNGYGIMNAAQKMYSPWSIMNYCQEKTIGPYWEQSGSLSALQILLKHQFMYKFMKDLLVKKSLSPVSYNELKKMSVGVYGSIYRLLRAYPSTNSISLTDLETGIIAILAQSGYLTYKSHTSGNYDHDVVLKIPNFEIQEAFQKIFDNSKYFEFVAALTNSSEYWKQISKCVTVFRQWFLDTSSNQDELENLRKEFKELFEFSTKFISTNCKNNREVYFNVENDSLNEAALRRLIAPVITEVGKILHCNVLDEFDRKVVVSPEKEARRKIDLGFIYEDKALILELKCNKKLWMEDVLQQAKRYMPVLQRHEAGANLFEVVFLAMNYVEGELKMKEERLDQDEIKKLVDRIKSGDEPEVPKYRSRKS